MLFNVGSQLVNILHATFTVIYMQLPWKGGVFKKLVENTCVFWVKHGLKPIVHCLKIFKSFPSRLPLFSDVSLTLLFWEMFPKLSNSVGVTSLKNLVFADLGFGYINVSYGFFHGPPHDALLELETERAEYSVSFSLQVAHSLWNFPD